ncbi:MAG: molybdate ABC transporter permease subunit [Chloroflexota bacterium]|nr:MAG: molybdate ABC transporter permease subunit [Chloroflexota bacterium]
MTADTRSRPPDHSQARNGRSLWRDPWWLASLPLVLFLALPLLALILSISPAQLMENLAKPQVRQAIGISLKTTLITTTVTILFGTPLAYVLARRQFRFRRVLDTLVDMPIVLPPAVAGVALLIAFGRQGLVGGWLSELGIHIAFTQAAVIIAQTFVAAPFYVKAASTGFASVDTELEHAAAIDGAGSWQAFRHVTVPLAWAAMLSGAVMTWARALGEFGATILFAGNYLGRTQTMPLAIYIGFELDLDVALTLAAIMVVISFLVLFLVKGILHRELYTVSGS